MENETPSIVVFIAVCIGCAHIYPCIIHSTSSNLSTENSGAIIVTQMASGYLRDLTFISPLFVLLGKWSGFEILPVNLIIFVVLMLCMIERTFRLTAKT